MKTRNKNIKRSDKYGFDKYPAVSKEHASGYAKKLAEQCRAVDAYVRENGDSKQEVSEQLSYTFALQQMDLVKLVCS